MRLIIFFIFTHALFAKEAVVRVLEAPLFKNPSTKSLVIQYKRKGQEIYLHNDGSKLENFYQTMTHTGDVAYVLKKHVYVYYESAKELDQKELVFDETDYRIPEPLPKGYPIEQESGYRGLFYLSFGSTQKDSYPSFRSQKNDDFTSMKSLGFVWQREVKFLKSRRFFHGANIVYSYFTQDFQDSSSSIKEKHLLFTIGPYLSYDAYKTESHIISMNGSLDVHLVDSIDINLSGQDVSYSTFTVSSKLGSNFSFRKAVGPLDFTIGLNLKILAPRTYKTTSPTAIKSYKTTWVMSQELYIGLQSDY